MSENLSRLGLFFDDLNRVRVLENEISQQSSELREECRDFVDRISEFQSIADNLLESAEELSRQVEREKIKALQARNRLKCAAEQRAGQQQQLQALILERRAVLERLQIEYQALQRTEQEQLEMIQHLSQQ